MFPDRGRDERPESLRSDRPRKTSHLSETEQADIKAANAFTRRQGHSVGLTPSDYYRFGHRGGRQ